MGTVDSITDLANALEVFFKGLSECGLLTTYSVQLQVTTVDFVVQIKFRCVIYQFMKSLQALLLKTPTIPGHENSHDITTQTPDCNSNIVEVKLPNSNEQQISPVVETCMFTQTENSLNWEEARSGDGSKEESIATTAADIIVTCHPATLAAITGQNFITTTSGETTVLKPCGKESSEQQQCAGRTGSDVESENKSVVCEMSSVQSKSSSSQFIDLDDNKTELTVTELKPYISSENTRDLSAHEQIEPLVLEAYAEEHGRETDSPKFTLDSSNVMHIVVASAEQEKEEEETNVETEEEDSETAIFICEVCERTFITARSLEIHLNLKHRNKGQCDMCPLRFSSVQGLQEHCKTDHGGSGCFNCDICSRRFMTKLSYKRHMDTHGGKKGAVCDMCGKTFSRTDYLQKHYMTHNGNRPFTCLQCPRKFISSSQLKVHEKTHSGVKEHICDMCNKAFSRGDKLKEHMLRHLNIKRFQCSYCKRYYAEKRDLTKHLKVHTNGK
ncbi:zinc finger protein 652 [Anabrus simplex]|uniref:zinc finger protein 652 n=1 Tax=Anabrus simplex TaxID=316456 RepID=UPI0035A37C6B